VRSANWKPDIKQRGYYAWWYTSGKEISPVILVAVQTTVHLNECTAVIR